MTRLNSNILIEAVNVKMPCLYHILHENVQIDRYGHSINHLILVDPVLRVNALVSNLLYVSKEQLWEFGV